MSAPDAAPAPRRELGLFHGVGVVIGAIVGVGIFLSPGKVAGIAGSAGGALLLWALGGAIALAGAFTFAALGRRFPESGGELVALRRLWGPLPAFLFGWSLIGAIQTGVLALIALFGAGQVAILLGAEWDAARTGAVATAGIALLAAVNLVGVRPGAWVQSITSTVKVALLLGLAVLAAWALTSGHQPAAAAAPMPASDAPWLAGLAATLFSYGGFHQLTWLGGEVRRPERTIPLAIVIGVCIVVGGYLAANAAYFTLLPAADVAASSSVAADAVASMLPGIGRIAALALAISAFGIANSQVLTAPRAYFALAQEGLFPRALTRLDPRRGVPNAAILVQSGLAIAMVWLALRFGDAVDSLMTGVVFVDWVFHMIAAAGLLRLGIARAPAALFIAGAAIGLGATFWDPAVRAASLLGCAWIALGTLVFFLAVRPKLHQRSS